MSLLRPPIAVVLFDAVGTLMYPRPSVAEVYEACGRRQGATLPAAVLAARFPAALAEFTRDFATPCAKPCTVAGEYARWRSIVSHVFAEEGLPPDRVEAIFVELWQHFALPTSWAVYDDVPQVLAELARRGYRLGVASNFDQRLETIFHGLPVLAPCGELFPVTRVGWAKPAPAYYARVAKLLQVPASQILLVGDDIEHDVHAARRAGWQAVLLERKADHDDIKHQDSNAPPIGSLAELPALLASLAGLRAAE